MMHPDPEINRFMVDDSINNTFNIRNSNPMSIRLAWLVKRRAYSYDTGKFRI